MHRRGIVPLLAVREANVLLSRAPVELLLVPCRFLPKLTRIGKRGSCGCSFACDAIVVPTELRHTMKLSDLTSTERKVWQAAVTGTLVDLRVGDSQLDSAERWTEWETERTVRAEVIADLLLGGSEAADTPVRGVRLQGARIAGELNLEATMLRCPLALLDCSFAYAINLNEATALSVRLSGSHVPAVRAKQLLTRGDLRLDKGFRVSGGVELNGAHIGGDLACTGGHFSNSDGPAINADRLTVDQEMHCDGGFSATGEVSLLGAHIGGQLSCRGGQFSNPDGCALTAAGLAVDGDMFCDKGFSVTGEVRLPGAHIGGVLVCTGGQFSNPGGIALNADRLTVNGSMFCDEGFSATGEVRLPGAHIGGVLDCESGLFSNPNGRALTAYNLTVDQDMYCRRGFSVTGEVRLPGAHIGGVLICRGGQFSNPDGYALNANSLTVDGDMYCDEGFAASGEVNLPGAHIGGQLSCKGGKFSNPKGLALNLGRATVSGPLHMETAVLQGIPRPDRCQDEQLPRQSGVVAAEASARRARLRQHRRCPSDRAAQMATPE